MFLYLDLLSERLAPPPTFGLRSVLVPVLPTQHNRQDFIASRSVLSTAGRRPFAPRSPADLAIGDIAKFTKPDGRICRGTVKFIGHLHDKNDTYIGLELEHQGNVMCNFNVQKLTEYAVLVYIQVLCSYAIYYVVLYKHKCYIQCGLTTVIDCVLYFFL